MAPSKGRKHKHTCSVWLAEVDTRHYNFKAVGCSRSDAEKQFRALWREWRRATGATISVSEILEAVRIIPLHVGAHLVDDEPI